MAHTYAAYSTETRARRRARELQDDTPNVLVAVVMDAWTEPYAYRVIGYELDEAPEAYDVLATGVMVVYLAKRNAPVVALPAPAAAEAEGDVVGEYRAKRRRRRRKAA